MEAALSRLSDQRKCSRKGKSELRRFGGNSIVRGGKKNCKALETEVRLIRWGTVEGPVWLNTVMWPEETLEEKDQTAGLKPGKSEF